MFHSKFLGSEDEALQLITFQRFCTDIASHDLRNPGTKGGGRQVLNIGGLLVFELYLCFGGDTDSAYIHKK